MTTPVVRADCSPLEGVLLVAAVATLGALAVSTSEPVTYVVFPALIWAALVQANLVVRATGRVRSARSSARRTAASSTCSS